MRDRVQQPDRGWVTRGLRPYATGRLGRDIQSVTEAMQATQPSAMTKPTVTGDQRTLLTAMLNLTAAHREHEKFYSVSPREQAVTLQRHSRTLHALADRWMTVTPEGSNAFSPYQGADDLNALPATQLDGVLFMEGEGEPVEIAQLKPRPTVLR